MDRLKKIGTGVFILTATAMTPILPEQMVWQYSYEVPCKEILAPSPKSVTYVLAKSAEYKPESCVSLIGNAYVSVFKDSNGNLVFKEVASATYHQATLKDGFKHNPSAIQFKSLLNAFVNKLEAAIAYDSSQASNSPTGTSYTVAYTMGSVSNGLLVISLEIFTTSDIMTSITYNGVAMTRIDRSPSAGAGASSELWYLINPSSGSNNIVANWSSSNSVQLRISSYSGAKQSGQPDASVTFDNESDSNGHTQALTSIADNSWHILGLGNSICSTWNAGTGSTLRQASSCNGIFDSNGPKTPAGSYSMSVNLTSGSTKWYGVMASFAPAVDANPTPILDLVKSFWW